MNTNNKISSEEFENIYCDYYPLIYRTAFSILKNEHDAWDAVQNIYVKILTSAGSVSDKSKMKSWIMSVTYNECKNMLKVKSRELSRNACGDEDISEYEEYEELTDFDSNPMCIADDDEFKEEILSLIGCLPQNQQKVIFLYYYKQYSVDEIAAALDVSAGTVKSRLNYARKNLKILIGEYESQHKVRLHSGFVAMLFADIKRCKLITIKHLIAGVSAAAVISGCAMGASSVFQELHSDDKNVPLKYEYVAEVTDPTSTSAPEVTTVPDTSHSEQDMSSYAQNVTDAETVTAASGDTTPYEDTSDDIQENHEEFADYEEPESIEESFSVTSVSESTAISTTPVYTDITEYTHPMPPQEFSQPVPPENKYEDVRRTELFNGEIPPPPSANEPPKPPEEGHIHDDDDYDDDRYGESDDFDDFDDFGMH